MKDSLQATLTEIAKRARAIIPCEQCGNFEVIADDEEAEQLAHAMVTNAWKRGEFGLVPIQEVSSGLQAVLLGANHRCPSCDRDD